MFLTGTSFWGIDRDIPHLLDSCLQERKHLRQYTGDERVYVPFFVRVFLKFFLITRSFTLHDLVFSIGFLTQIMAAGYATFTSGV